MSRKASYNPVRSALNETLIILVAWTVGCTWVLGYCAQRIYSPDAEAAEGEVPLLFGFPAWVVWAIAVPWIVSNLFTIWFCAFYMQEDDDPGGNSG